jgi:uncharacterized membrane protein
MGHSPSSNDLKEHWTFVVILVVYLGLGLAYSMVTPAFEAPDEPGHFSYVRHLVVHRRFPIQQPDPKLSPTAEAHQPPLYYLLAAALTAWIPQADFEISPPNPCAQWSPDLTGQRYIHLHSQNERFPYRDGWLALHIVRAFSVFLGGLTIWTTYHLGRTLWPLHRTLGSTAATVLALNPQFLFIHGTVNNDNLATALSALLLLIAVRALTGPPRWRYTITLGLLLGLSALTKYSAVALGAIALVGVLAPHVQDKWRVWLRREPSSRAQAEGRSAERKSALRLREKHWRQAIAHLVVFGAIPVFVAGWWYVRNMIVYGEPLAWQVALDTHSSNVRTAPFTWADLRLGIPRILASFWGYFGWLNVRLGPSVYIAVGLVTIAGIVGLLIALLRPRIEIPRGLFLVLLAVVSVAASLGRFLVTINHTGYQGRLLFAAASAIAVLLAFGWARLLGVHRPQLLLPLVAAGGLAMNAVGINAILGAYPRSEIYETAYLSGLSPSCVVLDERLQLLAYQVSPQVLRSGETIQVDFHWFGLQDVLPDGLVRVRLLGRNDDPLGETTFVPNLRYDRVSTDRISWPIGETSLPTRGRLQFQWLDNAGDAVPLVTRNRHPAGKKIELLPIKVVPAQSPHYVFQEFVNARFGEAITLLGYNLSTDNTSLGHALHLTLYWRAEASLTDDYTVFVHLLDAAGTPVAQTDGQPLDGDYPTTLWAAGEQIEDARSIPLEKVTAGEYRLGVGWYLLATGERLPAIDAAGDRLPGDVVILERGLVVDGNVSISGKGNP